jgi:hypothetical protein
MCPENATRIGSAEACERAAAAMGREWKGSDNVTEYPSGCYANKGGDVYFNTHLIGSGYPEMRPLCAVGASTPRSRALRAARDCHNALLAVCTGTAEHRPPRQCGVAR